MNGTAVRSRVAVTVISKSWCRDRRRSTWGGRLCFEDVDELLCFGEEPCSRRRAEQWFGACDQSEPQGGFKASKLMAESAGLDAQRCCRGRQVEVSKELGKVA